jgi:chromatin structure-remodeling complex protein RSC7
MQPTHARIEQVQNSSAPTDSKVFPPLNPIIARNFKVVDYIMETPPASLPNSAYQQNYNVPDVLAPFQGLGALSDEIKDLLPPECRAAFDEAVAKENDWKSKWGPEAEVTHRRQPIIDAAIVPYSKM